MMGLRYFNVYGPRESHKKAAASLIYQLYQQMKAGRRPRVFRAGEHRRDFVYVKDVVAMTIAALGAPQSTILNCGSGQPVLVRRGNGELNRLRFGAVVEPRIFENPVRVLSAAPEADMTKARTELNFVPQYPPARGIAEYVGSLEGREA